LTHYLFYQHNVQRFFITHIEKFDGILVPFSIAASFPAGTYGFLRALLGKDQTKRFALDPRSALFQQGWNRSNIREPHRKMAAIFGEPFTSVGLLRALTPHDLPTARINEITKSCIQYQLDFKVQKDQQRKLEKYRKLLGIDTVPKIANPQHFVPPYFRFSDVGDEWYEISMSCAEQATTIVPANQLCPIIHFAEWPTSDEWQAVAVRLKNAGISSLFMYPNNFREHEATEEKLQKYVESTTSVVGAGITAIALHGGYLSILLEKKGLSGFGNGVGYGEWRDSGYHRGGTAEIRLYIPKLHRFLDPAKAQSLISGNPEYFAADSDLLNEYALSNKPLTSVSLQEALDHFMDSRQREIEAVRDNTLLHLTQELADTVEVLKAIGQLEAENYGPSLTRWRSVLSKA
jgi:DNA-binding XRE family transcriptional regulator